MGTAASQMHTREQPCYAQDTVYHIAAYLHIRTDAPQCRRAYLEPVMATRAYKPHSSLARFVVHDRAQNKATKHDATACEPALSVSALARRLDSARCTARRLNRHGARLRARPRSPTYTSTQRGISTPPRVTCRNPAGKAMGACSLSRAASCQTSLPDQAQTSLVGAPTLPHGA